MAVGAVHVASLRLWAALIVCVLLGPACAHEAQVPSRANQPFASLDGRRPAREAISSPVELPPELRASRSALRPRFVHRLSPRLEVLTGTLASDGNYWMIVRPPLETQGQVVVHRDDPLRIVALGGDGTQVFDAAFGEIVIGQQCCAAVATPEGVIVYGPAQLRSSDADASAKVDLARGIQATTSGFVYFVDLSGRARWRRGYVGMEPLSVAPSGNGSLTLIARVRGRTLVHGQEVTGSLVDGRLVMFRVDGEGQLSWLRDLAEPESYERPPRLTASAAGPTTLVHRSPPRNQLCGGLERLDSRGDSVVQLTQLVAAQDAAWSPAGKLAVFGALAASDPHTSATEHDRTPGTLDVLELHEPVHDGGLRLLSRKQLQPGGVLRNLAWDGAERLVVLASAFPGEVTVDDHVFTAARPLEGLLLLQFAEDGQLRASHSLQAGVAHVSVDPAGHVVVFARHVCTGQDRAASASSPSCGAVLLDGHTVGASGAQVVMYFDSVP